MTEQSALPEEQSKTPLAPIPILVTVAVIAFFAVIFWGGFEWLLTKWDQEEYNHGYLIPVVAFYLLWLRAEELHKMKLSGSWLAPFIIVLALCVFMLGELSSIFQIIGYGFLMALFGIIIGAVGWAGFKIIWVPFVYLIFMIPLPEFIYQGLSSELQLISSKIGVEVIRFFGISVFLEGNVIDLGVYQLQVAEACNGLRYLFPLMSFGFLCAAIYQGAIWHKVVIFVSTVPITILMNSFRIGVIDVLVENFGIEQAEGFLHLFEGWIVFMACVGLLFLEMWAFAKMRGNSLMQVFGLDFPPTETMKLLIPRGMTKPFLASVGVLALGVVVAVSIQSREMKIPERATFNTFPLLIDSWTGRDALIEDQNVLNTLGADDYFLAEYWNREMGGTPVNLWIAYYEEQRKGRAVHSPRACLPGGGWKIESIKEFEIENVGPNGENYIINRSVIVKGDLRQLVYFWFVERGRIQTNEFVVKWYIFWDALTRNRTEGALVRVSTLVADPANLYLADESLQSFIRSLNPKLAYHLPQENATFKTDTLRSAAD